MQLDLKNSQIAVVGLGYVGMPLALGLSKHFPTLGFDINEKRVEELSKGLDANREVRQADLRASSCVFTANAEDIKDCNIYIVTVPTPIDAHNKPDLGAVRAASETVGCILKHGDIVVYESTVYPGVTENICGPILENKSGLKAGQGFYLGYSPERINPGDTVHTVENITKVVAGQTPEITDFLAEMYGRMNGGQIFKATSIKVAEASKAIENAQRDINVAFVNEVAMVLNKLGLSAHDVLEAARSKWNFLPFSPGLVGGHCIGVDPYYLAQCAQDLGHEPEVILSGRKINDGMGNFVAERMDRMWNEMTSREGPRARILLLGFTFKENINDIRNTKVIDIYNRLKALGHSPDIHDPHASSEAVQHEYGIELLPSLPKDQKYDIVTLLVGHKTYQDMTPKAISSLLKEQGIVYDIKGLWKGHDFTAPVSYRYL